MKLNYKEKRILNPSENVQTKVEFIVEEQKLNFAATMLNLKKSIEIKKNEIIEAYTEYPLDFNKILNLECELANMQDDREHLNHIGFKLGFVEAIDIPMKKFKEFVEKVFTETANEEPVEEPVDSGEEKEPVVEPEEAPTK